MHFCSKVLNFTPTTNHHLLLRKKQHHEASHLCCIQIIGHQALFKVNDVNCTCWLIMRQCKDHVSLRSTLPSVMNTDTICYFSFSKVQEKQTWQ